MKVVTEQGHTVRVIDAIVGDPLDLVTKEYVDTLPGAATGPAGVAGATGPAGVQGATGPAGVQGVTGPAGVTGSQGITGPAGVQGSQGVTGTAGVQGSPGATGAAGVQGSPGATGAPGVSSFATGGDIGAAATSATTGTMTVSMTTAVITITPTGACTFNASGGVAGQVCTFHITTSGTSSFTLTWGTNFRKTGTLATGTVSARFFSVTFRCINGTVWSEIARTVVQT